MTSNNAVRDRNSATEPEWNEEQIISSLDHLREIHAQVPLLNSSPNRDANGCN